MANKRCSNFTKDEVEMLVVLVDKYKEVIGKLISMLNSCAFTYNLQTSLTFNWLYFISYIIECKKTDCTSNARKEAEWKKIEVQFNASCGTGRTAKMLRSKWDSMKKTTKKEYAEKKQQFYGTGGGPMADIKLESTKEKILEIVGVGATGLLNQYDSDLSKYIFLLFVVTVYVLYV